MAMDRIPLVRVAQFAQIVSVIEAAGASPERLLRKLRMPMWHHSAPEGFVPCSHFHRLFDRAAKVVGCATFGVMVMELLPLRQLGDIGPQVARAPHVYGALAGVPRIMPRNGTAKRWWLAQKLQSEAALAKAQADLGAPGDDNAQLRAAKAAVQSAELDLEFTEVKAPVTGYVTNLDLRLGDQAVANQPALALVDITSFWIDGFFRETLVGRIRPGDRAVVTLMSYPDQPVEGRVDSIGWGIAQEDGSTGFDLLPTVSPTFEWIRLAERIPVRVHLLKLPEGVELRVGATASVLVLTGDQSPTHEAPVAAPRALQ